MLFILSFTPLESHRKISVWKGKIYTKTLKMFLIYFGGVVRFFRYSDGYIANQFHLTDFFLNISTAVSRFWFLSEL